MKVGSLKGSGFPLSIQVCAIALGVLALAGILSAEEKTAATIEPLYRAHRFSTHPRLNPAVSFAIQELRVPDLLAQLGVQLFIAHDKIYGQEVPRDPFLWFDGRIQPFVVSVGGHGVMSGIVAGKTFYYSYSWGSGIHRSHVGRLTVQAGQLVQQESGPLVSADMCVEKTKDGRIRVVEARWRDFNRWENPTPLGWIDEAEPARLKIIDDSGREVSLPPSPGISSRHTE